MFSWNNRYFIPVLFHVVRFALNRRRRTLHCDIELTILQEKMSKRKHMSVFGDKWSLIGKIIRSSLPKRLLTTSSYLSCLNSTQIGCLEMVFPKRIVTWHKVRIFFWSIYVILDGGRPKFPGNLCHLSSTTMWNFIRISSGLSELFAKN